MTLKSPKQFRVGAKQSLPLPHCLPTGISAPCTCVPASTSRPGAQVPAGISFPSKVGTTPWGQHQHHQHRPRQLSHHQEEYRRQIMAHKCHRYRRQIMAHKCHSPSVFSQLLTRLERSSSYSLLSQQSNPLLLLHSPPWYYLAAILFLIAHLFYLLQTQRKMATFDSFSTTQGNASMQLMNFIYYFLPVVS